MHRNNNQHGQPADSIARLQVSPPFQMTVTSIPPVLRATFRLDASSSAPPPSSPLHILDLPSELLYHLCHFFPLDALLSLTLVHSAFASLVRNTSESVSLWRNLYLQSYDDPRSSARAKLLDRLKEARDLPSTGASASLDWKRMLMETTIALRHARSSVNGDCCYRLAPNPLDSHYAPLLGLAITVPPSPQSSLNRLQLSSFNLLSLPRPTAESHKSVKEAYHHLRALLLDHEHYPLSRKEKIIASRAVWLLTSGSALVRDGSIDWERVEDVKRLADDNCSSIGDFRSHRKVASHDSEDWAGIEGFWTCVTRFVSSAAAHEWRQYIDNPTTLPKPRWDRQVEEEEDLTSMLKSLTFTLSPQPPPTATSPALSPTPKHLNRLEFTVHYRGMHDQLLVQPGGYVTFPRPNDATSTPLIHFQVGKFLGFDGIFIGEDVVYGLGTLIRTEEERAQGYKDTIVSLFKMWR